MKLELITDLHTETETLGKLYVNGKYFCETLEDAQREKGVKIHGKTAIPYGEYQVIVNMSPRFKRRMPLIFNQKDYSISMDGVRFVGVRFHGGNTHLNTDGCPLVAYTRKVGVSHSVYKSIKNWIFGTAEKELTALIEKAIVNREKVTLIKSKKA